MNHKELYNNDNHITICVDKPRVPTVSMLSKVKHKLLPRQFVIKNYYMLTRFIIT